jgi:hypothetical protein
MAAEAANTYVSILRGTGEDSLGDPTDSTQVLYEHLPAILVETGKQVQDPSTASPRTIRAVECHVPYWTGMLNTDRIVDEQTNDTYIVIGVTRPPTLFGAPADYRLDLKRVTAATS